MTDLANQIFPHPTNPTPPDLPETPELITLDSLVLRFGELTPEEQVEVVESITSFSVTLRSNGVSQISFTVLDPNFRMHDNNYFLVQRVIEFNNMLYEVASVSLTHRERDTVQIIARNFKMQQIRREKGNHSWGAISPTALARITARKHGLGFVGETSPVKGTISRVQNDKKDESTFDILTRLAKDLEFRFFEAKDYMFFASEDYIVDVQGQTKVYIPGRDADIDPVTGGFVTDVIFPLNVSLKRDEDAEKPATFNVNAYTNATTQQLYPGFGCSFKKIVETFDGNELVSAYEEPFPNYEDLFMIDQVNYTMTPNQPTVFSGTSVNPSADMLCSIQDFKSGDKGACVKRIQRGIGMADAEITGTFDSATENAVREFQYANINAYRDTPQFQGDNWKAYLTLGEVGRVTWSWIKAVNMSKATVPIPPVRPKEDPFAKAPPPDPADDPIFGFSGIYDLDDLEDGDD